MTDTGPSLGRTHPYRFSRPGDVEIETREFDGDDAAEVYARGLSKAQEAPVIIHRHDHVDWEYLSELAGSFIARSTTGRTSRSRSISARPA
jgi:hypothetical protein